jgi:hypothetical protein
MRIGEARLEKSFCAERGREITNQAAPELAHVTGIRVICPPAATLFEF